MLGGHEGDELRRRLSDSAGTLFPFSAITGSDRPDHHLLSQNGRQRSTSSPPVAGGREYFMQQLGGGLSRVCGISVRTAAVHQCCRMTSRQLYVQLTAEDERAPAG